MIQNFVISLSKVLVNNLEEDIQKYNICRELFEKTIVVEFKQFVQLFCDYVLRRSCLTLMIESWNYRSYSLCRQSVFNFFKDFALEVSLFIVSLRIEVISEFWMFKSLWSMSFRSYLFQRSRFRRLNMFRSLKTFNFRVHGSQRSDFSR